MRRHTHRVVILFSLLVSISLLSLNSYGQGGSAEKTPPKPSTKQVTKKNVARTTTRRTNRSSQSSSESESQPTDSQPSNSPTSSPNTSPTPAPTPAPVEPSAPEPSLNETMEWLGAKLTDRSFFDRLALGVDNNTTTSDYRIWNIDPLPQASFSVDHCTLGLMTTTSTPGHGISEFPKSRIVISFGDIEPRSIENCNDSGYDPCLRMKTSGSRTTLSATTDPPEGMKREAWNATKKEAAVVLFFRDYEGRERAKKAIARAVQLCGGKSDPF